MPATSDAIRIFHRHYGRGAFLCLLPEPGHVRAQFDIDDGIARRVLRRDFVIDRGEMRPVEDAVVAS